MSILYDEGQQAIATESRRVLDARMDKARLLKLLEQVGQHDGPFWDTAVEQGWTALAIPEEHGGLGLGLIELGLVAQACGAATSGAPFLTGGYGLSQALVQGGDAALAAEWLPKLASGEATGCVAFAEGNAALPPAPGDEVGERQRNIFQQQAHFALCFRRSRYSLSHTAPKASSTDTPSLLLLAVTRSSLPSPLTSAAAT